MKIKIQCAKCGEFMTEAQLERRGALVSVLYGPFGYDTFGLCPHCRKSFYKWLRAEEDPAEVIDVTEV